MSSQGKYNLVIIYMPKQQSLSDFLTIKNMMAGRAPDICVEVTSTDERRHPDYWKSFSERPTLLFSPMPIKLHMEVRGRKLFSIRASKMEEVQMLLSAGFSVPGSIILTPSTALESDDWGPFTVTKPNRGMQGKGVRLHRTKDVKWVDPLSWPADDPRRGNEIVAQQYIHTGNILSCYRVMTVLGNPVYSLHTMGTTSQDKLDPYGSQPLDMVIAANNVPRKFKHCFEQDVIDLARAVHSRFDHLPSLGIDIVREADTGKLFVLELNSAGWHWHLSSDVGLENQRSYNLDHYGQFDALNVIANALIEKTRKLAV